MKPQRIQRKRTKGFRMQEVSQALNGLPCVYVGRGTKWGNPFTVADAIDIYGCDESEARDICVNAFTGYATNGPNSIHFFENGREQYEYMQAHIHELKGKNLACFCPLDCSCHADVLLELANSLADSDE